VSADNRLPESVHCPRTAGLPRNAPAQGW
jgi:hypothetical protein